MDHAEKHAYLADTLLSQLHQLVAGNQAQADDVRPVTSEAEDFLIHFAVSWQFTSRQQDQVEAGDAAAYKHFGDNGKAFEFYSFDLASDAALDTDLRADFLDALRAAGKSGMAESDQERIFHTFPSFSVREECSRCDGRGRVSCSNCGGLGDTRCPYCSGSGRVDVIDYPSGKSTGASETCLHCGGRGRRTCLNCRGRGTVKCSHCSGHGFLTRVREIQALAVPSSEWKVNTRFHPQALAGLLKQKGAAFFSHIMPFAWQGEQAGKDTHLMIYSCRSTAIQLAFSLKDKEYVCCAFSSPPIPYVRPAVFDDLFADELAFLQKYLSGRGLWGQRRALEFFSRYAGQPVLDQAMREIARCRTSQGQDTRAAVSSSCQGFISEEMAARLAGALNGLLDKVSPAYSPAVLVLLGLPVLLYAALLVEWLAEVIFAKIREDAWFLWFFSGLAVLLGSWVTGLVISVFSRAVLAWQRRKVPPAYRQKMRLHEASRRLRRWGLLTWLAASAYGAAAAHGWLPKTQGRLAMELTQAAYSRLQAIEWQAVLAPFTRSTGRRPPGGYSDEAARLPSASEQALSIQRCLQRSGYTLKADGKFGPMSRRLARQELARAGQPLPAEDAPLAVYYQAFSQLDDPCR